MSINTKQVYTVQHKLDWNMINNEVARKITSSAQYYIHEDIVSLIQRSDALKSISALVEAGVMRLPYPNMTFEFQATEKFRWIINLEEHKESESLAWFKAQAIFYHVPTQKTYYSSRDAEVRLDKEKFSATNVRTKQDAHAIICAVTMGLLFLNTRGIEKTHVSYGTLNKSRARSGKPSIPATTVVHIGTVFDRLGNGSKYVGGVGGHKRVHWRSGYTRMQPHGPNRSLRRPQYIEPCLVNYRPEEETPELPKKRILI